MIRATKIITPKVPILGCLISKKLTTPITMRKGVKPSKKSLIFSPRLSSHAARYKISDNLSISDGWKEKPPSWIQRLAP